MRIRFDSDGKSVGGKIYFAVVEEVMVDKDGKPVGDLKTTPRPEPISLEPNTAEQVAPVVQVVPESDGVAEKIEELNRKIERIIELMGQEKQVIERERIIERYIESSTTTHEKTVEPAKAEEIEEPAPEKDEVAEQPVVAKAVEAEPEEETEEEAVDVTALAEEEPEQEVEAAEEQPESEPVVLPAYDGQPVVADIDITAESAEQAEEANVVAVDADVAATGDAPQKKEYVRSPTFAEKMMASSEILQDRYDDLKNYALRFRKLKSRISKKFDSINQGRFHFVKLSVAGKTLKLYLNMDINTVDPKFRCHDMSDKKTYVTVPVLLRIKSGRAVKYAKRLIDQCAEQHGMLERRKPFIVDSIALIEESLQAKETADADFEELENMDDSAMTDDTQE